MNTRRQRPHLNKLHISMSLFLVVISIVTPILFALNTSALSFSSLSYHYDAQQTMRVKKAFGDW